MARTAAQQAGLELGRALDNANDKLRSRGKKIDPGRVSADQLSVEDVRSASNQEMGTVSAADLATPTGRVEVPEPAVAEPVTDNGLLQNVRNSLTFDIDNFRQNQTERQRLMDEQRSLASEGTLSDLFAEQQEEFQIPQDMRQLQDIQMQLTDLSTESLGRQSDIAREGGRTMRGAGLAVSAEQARNNVRSYSLAAQAAVLQGNIQTAQAAVQQAVNIAYQDRQIRNQNLINQINSVQAVLGEQRSEILEQEKRQYEEDQAAIQRVQAAIDTAVTAGTATAEEVASLTAFNPQQPGETDAQYRERAKKEDRAKYNTALDIVARQARQDYNLERAVKQRQYDKLGLEIQSINAKAAQAAQDAMSGKLSEDQYKIANDLRSEVNGMQEVKDAKDLEANTASLLAALEQENGVGDISAINSFQRLVVDPGVAVREGDVALLQTAQSWTDEAWLKSQGLVKGDKLTPKARQQMRELVEDVYRIRVDLVDRNTQQVRTIANEQGIDYGRYIGQTFKTFEQLRSDITPQDGVEFGVATTDEYLDTAINSLTNDPMANPFGVSLSQ